MENILTMDKEIFKQVYTNERLRNDVAYSVSCLDANSKFMYKKAVSFPISYIVNDEQIKICNKLIKQKRQQLLKKNKNNLLFCGMGMEFTPNFNDGIGNHRIITSFINSKGIKCFIGVGTSCKSDNLRIDFSIYDYGKKDKNGYDNHKYNYKELESKTPILKYTYQNVLNLVNDYFDCKFKKIVVDNYNIDSDVLTISPK